MADTIIIIPVKDSSERLRQKDVILLPFTLDYCQGRENVYTYGWLSEQTMDDMSNNCRGLDWHHIQLPRDVDCGHYQATIAACDILGLRPDAKVMMLQVTQPYRRQGLLDDVDARIGDKTVITATRVLTGGRLLTTDGRKNKMMDTPYIELLDGAVYGGRCRDIDNWWMMDRPSDVVVNRTIGVCDIDTPDDLRRCVRWI